jgi:hypothetical protein
MSGAFCPSCGLAVVPGYVRCPKCHRPLPRKRGSNVEGGTAVAQSGGFPVIAIAAIGLAITAAVIVYFAVRKSDPAPAEQTVAPAPDEPVGPEAPEAPAQPDTPAAPSGPDPQSLAAELERALKRERLWATVNVVGDKIDVRSGLCSDPAMGPVLDAAAASLREAGLTRIRCLEQSGRVVTDRDL